MSIVDGHSATPAQPLGPELERVADAVRRLTDQITRTQATTESLTDVAALLEKAADALEPHTPPWEFSYPTRPRPERMEIGEYFPFSPTMGRYNPLAPPFRIEVHDGKVSATGVAGSAYEGPPGCVHGGFIAQLFDDLLGAANMVKGFGGMTGTLTIRYRSPTPLMQPIRFEAECTGSERRKTFAKGELWFEDRLCAEAEGIFISVDAAHFAGAQVPKKP